MLLLSVWLLPLGLPLSATLCGGLPLFAGLSLSSAAGAACGPANPFEPAARRAGSAGAAAAGVLRYGSIAIDWTSLVGVASDRLWLRPLGLVSGRAATQALASGHAQPLTGPGLAFTLIEAIGLGTDRRPVSVTAPIAQLDTWIAGAGARFARRAREQLACLAAPRAAWAGFALDRPIVMGVVNVTPDSFSDGGQCFEPDAAVAHGRALLEAGADILDVGGESTRPGAAGLAPGEEIRRVEPVVRALAGAGAVVTIDTRHSAVMEAALAAGARIVNDVSALTHDPESLPVVARHRASVVLMHMRGEPRTMQRDPVYDSALIEVLEYLAARIAACAAAGIPRDSIAIDPGIGFGKLVPHNLELLAAIGAFHALGCAIVLGVSRKSTIARLSRGEPPEARLPGSLAAALSAVQQGVQILRVHDVAETRQALAIWRAIMAS
jgi:dihydropteroate synthase